MKRIVLTAAVCAALLSGCSKDEELDQVTGPGQGSSIPPVPAIVELSVGNRRVIVAWELSDSSRADEVRLYRIYRRDPFSGALVLADSSATSPKAVGGLTNGIPAYISVSSVLDSGLEGRRSLEVGATPAFFGMVIEGGRAATRSRTVQLNLTAPAGTRGVRVREGQAGEEVTRDFQSTILWLLSEGDGEKEVFVRFIDEDGNPSESLSDRIRLDTVARISSVDFDGASERSPGDPIVFTLDADETGGVAEVELGRGGPRRTLRDDGVSPDASAGDGVHTLRYVAEAAVQLVDAEIIGHYVDEAGNVAPEVVAPRRLTITDPPTAVVLEPPYGITESSVSLTWSRCFDDDFDMYRLLRGEQPNVAEDPERRIVAEIGDPTRTTFEDRQDLEEGKTYYYVVQTVDLVGSTALSNEVSATILDLFPDPVTLSVPDPVGETTIGLRWTQSFELDFESYRLYRSTTPGVDETDPLIATVTERERVTWQDSGLIENTDYYYRVFVHDNGGHTTPSNEVDPTTANADPPPVTLGPVVVDGTTVELSWSLSTIHDFEAYRIYRDIYPAVGEDATLVRSIDTQDTTTFQDAGLDANTCYYYRIFVVDDAGGRAGSNEREACVTANRPPRPVLSDSLSSDSNIVSGRVAAP